jgi:hypothetical protein
MRRIVAAFVLTLTLGACSSSGPEEASDVADDTTTTTMAAPSLEAAVRAYTAAFLGGDADAASGHLSDRCRSEAGDDFALIVASAARTYGDAKITSYSDDIDGPAATATYELDQAELNQTDERWLLVDGAWVNDDC